MKLERMDEFFAARVDGYDEHMRSNIEGASGFYAYTAALLPQEAECRVLDLGCGSGILSVIALLLGAGDATAVDIDPMAVEVDDPAEGAICTGSHIFHNDQHWLYYTVRQSDLSARPVLRSISEDGYHYRKDKSFCRSGNSPKSFPSVR